MTLRATRRELVSKGVLAAASGAVAAGSALEAASALAAPAQEARALTHAVEIEQLVVIAYSQALASGVTRPPVETELHLLLAQEREHVTLLEQALTGRGEIVPTAPGLAAAQARLTRHGVHWSLTHLRTQHDALKLLVDVESLAENAYFEAIEKVQEPALVRLSAEIMGAEAQHWTVLSGFLNHRDAMKAVPYPYVEGTP